MRNWFQNLSYKYQNWMQGRYGRDELTSATTIAAIVCLILSLFRPLNFILYIALALLIWSLYRSYSKNHAARVKELNGWYKVKKFFVSKFNLVKGMWRDRKTHVYLKCPNCKAYIRLAKPPKGKNIRITCPKCRNSFEKRT